MLELARCEVQHINILCNRASPGMWLPYVPNLYTKPLYSEPSVRWFCGITGHTCKSRHNPSRQSPRIFAEHNVGAVQSWLRGASASHVRRPVRNLDLLDQERASRARGLTSLVPVIHLLPEVELSRRFPCLLCPAFGCWCRASDSRIFTRSAFAEGSALLLSASPADERLGSRAGM